MTDTTKSKRGTQRTKKVTNKKETTKDQVVRVNASTVADSYLQAVQADLIPVGEYAKKAGISQKELANALEDKGVEFFAFDMMQKQPCDKNRKGDIFAQLV